jgi:hypothetical protein
MFILTYHVGSSRVTEIAFPTELCKLGFVDWVELRRRVLLSLDSILFCDSFCTFTCQFYVLLRALRYKPLTPVPEDSSSTISNTHGLFEQETR